MLFWYISEEYNTVLQWVPTAICTGHRRYVLLPLGELFVNRIKLICANRVHCDQSQIIRKRD